jgi:predicted metal-dependent enzyme (double-stranded beta helix superfamily)
VTATLRIPAREGIDALVAELREQVVPGRDWACTATGVAGVLQAHVPSPGLLTAAERRGTAGRAAGHRLHVEPDGSFSVLAIVWRRGQWTRIHDHVTWCVFAGLHGEVAEDLYRLDAPAATLLPAGRRTCEAGTVRCELPPGDIHRLGNPAADTAITLHVYGTDLDRLGSSARRTYELPVAPSDAHTPDELAGGRT